MLANLQVANLQGRQNKIKLTKNEPFLVSTFGDMTIA